MDSYLRIFFGLGMAAALTFAAGEAQGFAYTFADSSAPDRVTHPMGYAGNSGTLNISVGIAPSSTYASDMAVPTQNVVTVFNGMSPQNGNLSQSQIPQNQLDFESVLLHEMGHALGLDHPNIGGGGANSDFTQSFQGTNGVYDYNDGSDGIQGSADDLRSDDVNANWFRTSNNNPFTIAGTVDSGTYSRDVANDLPNGDNYSANASKALAGRLGYTMSEAVMQQGARLGETQRRLGYDDVAGLLYAQSGLDEEAGTEDDYSFNLNYAGMDDTADIVIAFDSSQTDLAVTSSSAQSIPGSDHYALTNADIFFEEDPGYNWHFNDTAIPEPASATLLALGATSLIAGRRRQRA